MDHGFTPYLSVVVDGSVRVPRQHVVDGEIVLNVSTDATGGLNLGDEFIEFKARFGGVAQQVVVPVERVSAIYARENGQGMAFPVQAAMSMMGGMGGPGGLGALGGAPGSFPMPGGAGAGAGAGTGVALAGCAGAEDAAPGQPDRVPLGLSDQSHGRHGRRLCRSHVPSRTAV